MQGRALWILLLVMLAVTAAAGLSAKHFKDARDAALARAEKAEATLAVEMEARAKITDALERQEKATAEAQSARTVVYRTVQKEVAKDETARDWYHAPIPAGFSKLLKDGASHD